LNRGQLVQRVAELHRWYQDQVELLERAFVMISGRQVDCVEALREKKPTLKIVNPIAPTDQELADVLFGRLRLQKLHWCEDVRDLLWALIAEHKEDLMARRGIEDEERGRVIQRISIRLDERYRFMIRSDNSAGSSRLPILGYIASVHQVTTKQRTSPMDLWLARQQYLGPQPLVEEAEVLASIELTGELPQFQFESYLNNDRLTELEASRHGVPEVEYRHKRVQLLALAKNLWPESLAWQELG
jgi:hypothetical protein